MYICIRQLTYIAYLKSSMTLFLSSTSSLCLRIFCQQSTDASLAIFYQTLMPLSSISQQNALIPLLLSVLCKNLFVYSCELSICVFLPIVTYRKELCLYCPISITILVRPGLEFTYCLGLYHFLLQTLHVCELVHVMNANGTETAI